MKYFCLFVFNFIVFLPLSTSLRAQTCCSGGVPVSSNLGLPIGESGAIQMNLSYDLNRLLTLNAEQKVLDDDSRRRTTHSGILELGYTFDKKWSADLLVSWVRQERAIAQNGFSDFSFSNGIGDAVVLVKYNLWFDALKGNSLTIGLGPKIPTGSYTKSSNGITLNADLQPGSGAWDGIAWLQFLKSLNFRPSMNFFAGITYAIKGKNKDYLGGTQIYQFGNETQITTGFSDKWTLGNIVFDTAVNLRFRKAWGDEVDQEGLPNTGGQWLFLNPSVAYWLNNAASINIGADLPVYADVVGTQLTPTYRLNVGFFYKLK